MVFGFKSDAVRCGASRPWRLVWDNSLRTGLTGGTSASTIEEVARERNIQGISHGARWQADQVGPGARDGCGPHWRGCLLGVASPVCRPTSSRARGLQARQLARRVAALAPAPEPRSERPA